MSQVKVNRFAKTRSCPPAEQLLSVSLAASPSESDRNVISHLEVCEFCCTEAHFLSRFHETTLPFVAVEIPPHLRSLAEAILKRRSGRAADSLFQSLSAKEELDC